MNKNNTQSIIESYDLSDSQNNYPNGGFPPLYIIYDANDSQNGDKNKKKREYIYKTHKTAVNINDIIKRVKNIKPIIERLVHK
jgi:hypothetical protein